MNHGKSIELFLVDGTTDGIITGELSNWNGKAIKIPRSDVFESQREDIKGAGVYFLFCKEDDETDSVYIGEAENIKDRLKNHINEYKSGKEKYYWNTAVMFVGSNVNKADIRYMENKLYEMAVSAGRYKVLTTNTYKNTKLKESQISMADEFIDNIKLIISTLGYRVLEETPKAKTTTKYYHCKGNGGDAIGFPSAGGFTVLMGSKISPTTAPSYNLKTRDKLIEDGVIVDLRFVKDYEFGSPSGACCTILGRRSNGNKEWIDDNGKTILDDND